MGDTRRLKQEFGEKLTFWGAIDTRRVLPTALPTSPEEVRRACGTWRRVALCRLARPQHPAGCSTENVVAMYDAAYELGRYPLEL